MGMTDKNLCNSCTNIGCEFQSGIVRTKCAFYTPPRIEPDNCGNYVVMQPTEETIPKDDYETRLKADMVAMLTDMLIDVKEIESEEQRCDYATDNCISRYDVENLIQQKINALK